MSDKIKTPPPAKAAAAASGNGRAPDGLRDRPVAAAPRSGPGRPPGAPNKPKAAAPAAPVVAAKSADFVYSKVGKAFRAVFNILAVKTNCDAWLLAPEEEKDLGEACGDILLDLGMADSTATKIVFAAGTVIAVGGSKAITYAAFENERRAARGNGPVQPRVPANPPHVAQPPRPAAPSAPVVKPAAPIPPPAVVPSPATIPAAAAASALQPFADPDNVIHETKPGVI